jgi:hypothetical protein
MIKENVFGSEYTNVPVNNISSWCTHSNGICTSNSMENNSFHSLKRLATTESQLLASTEGRKTIIQMMWTYIEEEKEEINREHNTVK